MMNGRDVDYLMKVDDECQYPVARCQQDLEIVIYHCTTLAAVESRNAANKEIQDRTAVDPVNAAL